MRQKSPLLKCCIQNNTGAASNGGFRRCLGQYNGRSLVESKNHRKFYIPRNDHIIRGKEIMSITKRPYNYDKDSPI